jgi:hypothetical protein
MLSNLLLVASVISLAGLVHITSTPMPGGDRGVGWALVFFVCGAAFVVFSGLLAWRLGTTSTFDWLSPKYLNRNGLIFFGWAGLAAVAFFGAQFKNEWHEGDALPNFLRTLSYAKVAIWMPILMLVPVFWLLNFWKNAPAAPPVFVQIPLKIGFAVGMLMLGGLAWGYFKSNYRQAVERAEEAKNPLSSYVRQELAMIGSQKPEDSIHRILGYTYPNVDAPEVREAAFLKIKERPNWENEIAEMLGDSPEWRREAYLFLSINRVDHPEIFVAPLKKGLLDSAAEIQEYIKNTDSSEDGSMYYFGIPEFLTAYDLQFANVAGADFRTEIKAVRKAFDTPKPAQFSDVEYRLASVLDDWLARHR